MHEKEAERLKQFLEMHLPKFEEEYHKMKPSAEKEKHGMMIHDMRSVKSKLKEHQYKKPWNEMEQIFYPKKKK